MGYSIAQISEALEATVFGDSSLVITGLSEPASAGPDDLALAMSKTYAEGLASGQAKAAILWDGADWEAYGLKAALVVPRARYAMSNLTKLLDQGPQIQPGIHPSAIVDPTAKIADDVAIAPFVVIGPGVEIGTNARIAQHCSVSERASLGDNALLMPGVRIGAGVQIGANFIAQPGAVIGSDGFSFVTPEKSTVESARENLGQHSDIKAQSWTRIHSLGSVRIGDNVEVGANSTIDAGTIRPTQIGDGTKLDNLVHVGHNVVVGKDCLLCGQVGIAGSTKIGDRVVLGGQCGVSDNIFIGDDVVAGGATKILSNVPAGRVLLGYPAVKMDTHIEMQKALRRLPRFMKTAKRET